MSEGEWKLPREAQPSPEDCDFDLDQVLAAVLGVRSIIPSDAFTVEALGPERAGNGVLIGDGLVLTIGYLIIEAETIWLTLPDGTAVPGHGLAYDQETGFGLVQALARLDLPALPLGESAVARIGERVVVAGAGGRERSLTARIVGRQEFAGYWEYVVEEALFTAPAHPHWGGTGVIGPAGKLIGIGSLQLQAATDQGDAVPLNMVVPIDLLKPILDDLLRFGRANRPPRPWLGLYATGFQDRVVVVGLATCGPAHAADLRTGDVVLAVDGTEVSDLAGLYRRVWSLGDAGVKVPLTIHRDGRVLEMRVRSADRAQFLKAPMVH